MRVIVYTSRNRRARSVAQHCYQGLAECREEVRVIDESLYSGPPDCDYVVWYGLGGNGMRMLADFQEVKMPFAFVDLGYWGRKREQPPFYEYHRISVNSYQPTKYLRRGLPPTRFQMFGKAIQPWKTGGEEILVVGMSDKAARVWQLGSGTEHAQWLVDEVRKHTDRPIAYSPKPSWDGAQPIEGTRYARGPLQQELSKAHCVVTLRSNVSIDALLAGIPCFVLSDAPASLMGHQDLSKIETPMYPEDRLGFCADLAWAQFNLQEISSGRAWVTLKGQGLLP